MLRITKDSSNGLRISHQLKALAGVVFHKMLKNSSERDKLINLLAI